MTNGNKVTDLLELAWAEIDRLCLSFTDDQWALATALPLWTVKDIVAHLAATESLLLGGTRPLHVPSSAGSLPNRIAELNEVGVGSRRGWPPRVVHAEFRAVTASRLEALWGMSDEDFDRASWTPVGRGTYLDFMRTRLYDTWLHELDLCDATGRVMSFASPLADHALTMTRQFVRRQWLRDKVLLPGQSVRFDIAGPSALSFTLAAINDGLSEADLAAAESQVTIRMPSPVFVRLTAGRPVSPEDRKDIAIEGDRALGECAFAHLNVLF